MTTEEIAIMLGRYGFAASSEVVLHEAVTEFFQTAKMPVEAEYQLSARDRIDFYVPDGKIGIECKIDGGATEVMRQILRYMESPEIDGLVLVTSRNKHRAIPPILGGKPVYVVLTRVF